MQVLGEDAGGFRLGGWSSWTKCDCLVFLGELLLDTASPSNYTTRKLENLILLFHRYEDLMCGSHCLFGNTTPKDNARNISRLPSSNPARTISPPAKIPLYNTHQITLYANCFSASSGGVNIGSSCTDSAGEGSASLPAASSSTITLIDAMCSSGRVFLKPGGGLAQV